MYHILEISRLIAPASVWNILIQQELIEYFLHARQTCKILGYNLNPAVFFMIPQNAAYMPLLGKPLKIPLFSLKDDQQKHGFGVCCYAGLCIKWTSQVYCFPSLWWNADFPLKKQILHLKSI